MLGQVATLELTGGPAVIDRYDRSRNINFEIELSGMPRWHPFILLVQAAEDAAYRDATSFAAGFSSSSRILRIRASASS